MPGETNIPVLRRDPLFLATIMAILGSWGIGVHLMTESSASPPLVLRRHINPNEAGLPALMSLPGIGPAKAHAIVNYRRQNGPDGRTAFAAPSDLTVVPGIGPVTVQRLAPYLGFAPSSPPDAHEKVLDAAGDSIIMP